MSAALRYILGGTLLIFLFSLFVQQVSDFLARYPWVLFGVPAFWAIAKIAYFIRRRLGLSKRGFFLGWKSGGEWKYEELDRGIVRSVPVPVERTDPATQELFIPSVLAWDSRVPSWAKGRRDEIFERVIVYWKGPTNYPDDWRKA